MRAVLLLLLTSSHTFHAEPFRQQHGHVFQRAQQLLAFRDRAVYSANVDKYVQVSLNDAPQIPETKGQALKIFARVLGWVMMLGSTVVYSPILFRVIRTSQADGLSVSTWLLSLIGFGAATVYPARNGFPFSTYSEYVCLALQSMLLLFFVSVYGGHASPLVSGGAIALLTSAGVMIGTTIPLRATKVVQVRNDHHHFAAWMSNAHHTTKLCEEYLNQVRNDQLDLLCHSRLLARRC